MSVDQDSSDEEFFDADGGPQIDSPTSQSSSGPVDYDADTGKELIKGKYALWDSSTHMTKAKDAWGDSPSVVQSDVSNEDSSSYYTADYMNDSRSASVAASDASDAADYSPDDYLMPSYTPSNAPSSDSSEEQSVAPSEAQSEAVSDASSDAHLHYPEETVTPGDLARNSESLAPIKVRFDEDLPKDIPIDSMGESDVEVMEQRPRGIEKVEKLSKTEETKPPFQQLDATGGLIEILRHASAKVISLPPEYTKRGYIAHFDNYNFSNIDTMIEQGANVTDKRIKDILTKKETGDFIGTDFGWDHGTDKRMLSLKSFKELRKRGFDIDEEDFSLIDAKTVRLIEALRHPNMLHILLPPEHKEERVVAHFDEENLERIDSLIKDGAKVTDKRIRKILSKKETGEFSATDYGWNDNHGKRLLSRLAFSELKKRRFDIYEKDFELIDTTDISTSRDGVEHHFDINKWEPTFDFDRM